MKYKIEYVVSTTEDPHWSTDPGCNDRGRWKPCTAGYRWFLLSDRGTRLAQSDRAYKTRGAAEYALKMFLHKIRGGAMSLTVDCLRSLEK